jgi:acyl carrier protein
MTITSTIPSIVIELTKAEAQKVLDALRPFVDNHCDSLIVMDLYYALVEKLK